MPAALPNPQASNRRENAAVVTLALILRVAGCGIVLASTGAQGFFRHGLEMGWLAQSVLAGHGLASPFGVETGPTAFIAPVYPLLVALIFAVCGSFSVLSAAALMTVNLAANLATIWLILRLARRLFGRRAALGAGLFWACSPPLLFMPTILWETALSTAILTGVVTLLVERPALKTRGWLALGAACALAGLVNPALLTVFAALIASFAYQSTPLWRPRLQRLALVAVAFVIVFSPWPLRNANVFHAFIPLRTTVGFELWMGNRPGADGFLDEAIIPGVSAAELAEFEKLGEVGYTRHKQSLAETYIAMHPARFLRMTAVRAWRFWSGAGTRNGLLLYALHALLTTCAGLAGLFVLRRRWGWPTAIYFALPLLLFPLPYCITHAEFRYRLVIDPLLTVLAAGAFSSLFHRRNTSRTMSKPVDRRVHV